MTLELSKNEKEVLKVFFSRSGAGSEPSLAELVDHLEGKLGDKKNPPDPRYVSKLKSTALDKIYDSLDRLAKAIRLHVEESEDIHSKKTRKEKYELKSRGILKGFHFSLDAHAYLVYTLEEGPVAWYIHDDAVCDRCRPGGECWETLDLITRERGLEVPPEEAEQGLGAKAKWVLETLNGERTG